VTPPGLVTRETRLPAGWHYSVLRKAAMALSGLVLVAFLFGHWYGNLVLLDGEAAFNTYLAWLAAHPVLHYGVWIVLITAFGVHLAVGPRHWWYNRRARPVRYRKPRRQVTTWAARTMMLSGTLLLLFLIVHVAQVRGWPPLNDSGVYRNLRAGFGYWPIVTVYMLGQVALAFHLYHGLWSQFQTLGISHPQYDRWRRPLAVVIGVGIAALNIGAILLNVDQVRALPGALL
jgi:succinate dehydrogenase / fumarate reductase, cytochrome b subunit